MTLDLNQVTRTVGAFKSCRASIEAPELAIGMPRGPPDHRSLADRLQRQATAYEPQRAHTKRVCQPFKQGRKPEQSLLINEGNQGCRSSSKINIRPRYGLKMTVTAKYLRMQLMRKVIQAHNVNRQDGGCRWTRRCQESIRKRDKEQGLCSRTSLCL